MTHQRLREKAEVAKDWMGTDWFDDDWSVLRPFDFECSDFIKECTPETILSLLTELDAARKDAERYRWLRDPTIDVGLVIDKRVEAGKGIDDEMLFNYEYRAGEELDTAIDAALNADKGKDSHG